VRPRVNPLRGPRRPRYGVVTETGARRPRQKGNMMNILLIIVVVVAIILAITGGLVQSLQFLLWVGLVLLAIAVIAWLIRSISGKRSV